MTFAKFSFMEEMKKYILGDVCSRLSSGKGISSEEVFESGPYPVIGGNGLRGYSLRSNFSGECGVIGRQGAYCGNVRFFSGEAYMTEHAVVVVGNEKADTRYLTYLLSTMHLGNLSAQSAQPGLSVKTLAKQEIVLPSFPEQKKRASILASLEDKIDLNNRINHNLEEQAQALYKSWFVDFEPFKGGKFVDSELGMIPEGWVCAPLASILEYRKKAVNPQKFPDTLFTHYSLPAYDNSREPELQRGDEIMSNKFRLDNKMVLFSKLNPRIKRLWPIDAVAPDSICSTEFIAYKALKEQHHSFVWCYLNSDSFYEKVMAEVNGATGSHQRFHAVDTLDYIIPYNQIAISEFSEHATPILETIIKNERENRILKKERNELLPRLMAGDISITC